jgi:hypothetical protein
MLPLVLGHQLTMRTFLFSPHVIDPLTTLKTSDDVRSLASRLIAGGAVPASQPRDAFHIAIAGVHGIQYLVTWNFAHIANAAVRGKIEAVCRAAGFAPPIICTPEELAGEEDGEISNG